MQINNKFSSERDVITKVPQGSMDGPILFNLFINDLVVFIDQCTLKYMLLSDFMIVENWVFENCMILNPEKCYFMCIGKNVSHSELLNLNNLNLKKLQRG